MAIGFDNSNSVAVTAAANATTSAWTIGGSSRLLVAGMAWTSSGTPPNYSAVKWGGSGGTSLTQIGTTKTAPAGRVKVALAQLIAPTAASQTLYGEVSGSADELMVGGSSFTGVDQSSPVGTDATNGATPTADPVTATVDVTSAVGEVVVDVAGCYRTATFGSITIAAGASQTQCWEQETIGNEAAGTQSREDGAATVTMSEVFTLGASATLDWVIHAVPLKPSSTDGNIAWIVA